MSIFGFVYTFTHCKPVFTSEVRWKLPAHCAACVLTRLRAVFRMQKFWRFGGSFFRWVLWLNDTPTAKISQEVNRMLGISLRLRKRRLEVGTTLSTPAQTCAPQCTALQTG